MRESIGNAGSVTYFTTQKTKFFIKDFFSKCDCDLVTFPKEILNGKFPFLCSVDKALQETFITFNELT